MHFYTFLLNPAAPNSFSKHKIPFFFVLLLLSSNRLAWVSSWYMSLISVHWPTTEVISFVLISLVFVKFRTHVTDFLFPDWQRNRTCGDQCCFLLGSHSKVPRGNWFLRALMSYFRVRFQLNGYIFPQIGRVWTSHLLKIVPSLLGGLAGSVQTSWPLIWTISCKRGAVPCACKY